MKTVQQLLEYKVDSAHQTLFRKKPMAEFNQQKADFNIESWLAINLQILSTLKATLEVD